MTDEKKYVTLHEVDEKLEKLESKVLSKWEGRALILGAVVASNYTLPDPVTTTAVVVGVVGLAGKALTTLFLRS